MKDRSISVEKLSIYKVTVICLCHTITHCHIVLSMSSCHHVTLPWHVLLPISLYPPKNHKKQGDVAKSDSVTSPWAKAFCSFIQFTSIQNNKIKFKSINHTILQYWETISVQKNSFWSWNGGKSEKVIVWHLSLTNFCIWHHASYDQKNQRGFLLYHQIPEFATEKSQPYTPT